MLADTAEIALEITIKLNHMKTRLHFYQNKIHDALTILVCRTTKVITNVAVTSFSSPNKDVEYMNNFCRRSYNNRKTALGVRLYREETMRPALIDRH